MTTSAKWFQIVNIGYYIYHTVMFLVCSSRFSNVRSYIAHHLVAIGLMCIGWIINYRQCSSLLLFINNIVIYFFLSIVKLSRILNYHRISFFAFWIFFVTRNIAKIVSLKISFLVFQQPVFFVQIVINALTVLLIVHNIYFTYILTEMARKHYNLKSLLRR